MPVRVLGLHGGKRHGEGGRKRERKRERKRKRKEHRGEKSGKRVGSARRVDMEETQMWRMYVVNATCDAGEIVGVQELEAEDDVRRGGRWGAESAGGTGDTQDASASEIK
jgi:hypothetical protein